MCAPKDFIARANVHKVFIVTMQALQVTQATSFPKTILDIGCDHPHQAWPSYFLSMACICKGMCIVKSTGGNLKKKFPSKILKKN
jgi:hypothetical protein